MQETTPFDDPPSIGEQLHAIVDEMLAPHGKRSPRGTTLTTETTPPFDYSKSNQHDSKAEFLAEKNTVDRALNLIRELKNELPPDKDKTKRNAMIHDLSDRIDSIYRQVAARTALDEPVSLVLKSAAMVGGNYTLVLLLFEMEECFETRLSELEDQEQQFWNVSYRPPDYYAREIALRLARVFSREVGQKPTVGVSGIDGKPSTDFTRALAKTFELLEIKVQPRSPAEWAIGRLTDADLKPKQSVLDGMIARSALFGAPTRNYFAPVLAKQEEASD